MIDFSAFGWRDGIVLVAVLAGIYLALTVLRLVKVARPAPHVEPQPAPVAPAEDHSLGDLGSETTDDPGPMYGPARFSAWSPAADAPASPAIDFSSELSRSNLEVEVQQLRREGAQLREELAALRDELASLKATRNVSPLYSEAMHMAQSGVAAEGIAGQCGISLAEAQLVAALARGQPADDIDDELYANGEDPHGGYTSPRSRTGTNG